MPVLEVAVAEFGFDTYVQSVDLSVQPLHELLFLFGLQGESFDLKVILVQAGRMRRNDLYELYDLVEFVVRRSRDWNAEEISPTRRRLRAG